MDLLILLRYLEMVHIEKPMPIQEKQLIKKLKLLLRYTKKELLEEINEERIENGKKTFETLGKKEYAFDEETGEEVELKKIKHAKESTTDLECGLFHKDEKQKCFAYSHMTICDRYGYVLFNKVAPGNMHDSAIFSEIYNELINKYKNIKNVCLDAGFNTSPICHQILSSGKKPFLPYKRPLTKKDFFKNMNMYMMNIWISIFVQMKKIFIMSQPTEKDIESIKVIQKIVKGVHFYQNVQNRRIMKK